MWHMSCLGPWPYQGMGVVKVCFSQCTPMRTEEAPYFAACLVGVFGPGQVTNWCSAAYHVPPR